jgi:tight adherence protein B
MMVNKLLIVLALAVVLLLAAVGVTILLVREHDRDTKLKQRLENATGLSVRPATVVEEEVTLVRSISRAQQIKEKAASFIGVDLQQAETYPIKWWLVPPIAILLTCGITFLASHPLSDHPALLYPLEYIGTPVDGYLLTRFIFNMLTNRRNTKLIEQFPDALSRSTRRCASSPCGSSSPNTSSSPRL